jgi:hypothetical protein
MNIGLRFHATSFAAIGDKLSPTAPFESRSISTSPQRSD